MAILQRPKVKKSTKLNIMLPKVQMTVCCWKGKRRQLNESIPNEKAHGVSHSDTSANENHTENSFNKVTMV